MTRTPACSAALRLAAIAWAFMATPAAGTDWEADLDLRLVSSDGLQTFMEGGLGTLRYDRNDSGLELGRARFAVSQNFGEVWTAHLDASAWGDHDNHAVDLTEAYLQFRPYPHDGFRFRLRAGAFYSPISLENRAAGWESPYTVSYSAINTWFAEELRTIGTEAQLDWLGTRLGHWFDLALTGAVFGWNDPAGAVLATRGFSLDDRQTTLFGRVGSGSSALPALQLFREIDNRPGYYIGGEIRYFDRLVLRAMHYDNRADPSAFDPGVHEFAWKTSFNAAGVRVEAENGWTGIVQWLNGETYVEPMGLDLGWPFEASFALVSKQIGAHRVSVRYDRFEVKSEATGDGGAQLGHAWTAAYVFEPDAQHWRMTLEWLSVSSDATNRVLLLGGSAHARESQVQLAIRYALGSAVH